MTTGRRRRRGRGGGAGEDGGSTGGAEAAEAGASDRVRGVRVGGLLGEK